ncbi:MAG TPA: archaemetzincin [Thermoanaerobaculia bacterium]
MRQGTKEVDDQRGALIEAPARVRRITTALILFLACAAPEAMPVKRAPAPEEPRVEAIGPRSELPPTLARAFDPAAFVPLGTPASGDWLASHREEGQTFPQLEQSGAHRPDSRRHTLYLQPLGTFGVDAPALETLRRYAAAFFMLDVKLLPAIPLDASLTSRSNPYSGQRQVLTGDILNLLRRRLPPDAFCIIGITMDDLYPDPQWNFVFGQASFTERVGVYSFARYGADSPQVTLRRSCKVLTHETGHMFGVAHCIWFRCIMNGSNHLAESDARPMHLCPVDLRKLQWSIGFDVVERYRRLREVCREAHFDDEVQWLDSELARITSGSPAR